MSLLLSKKTLKLCFAASLLISSTASFAFEYADFVGALTGVNNKGQAVGYVHNYDHDSDGIEYYGQSYLYDLASNSYTLLNFPGALETRVEDINDSGMAVGFYTTSDAFPGGYEGFLYNSSTKSYTSLHNFNAYGINDKGIIIGHTYPGYVYSEYNLTTGSLTPVDELLREPQNAIYQINDSGQLSGTNFSNDPNGPPYLYVGFTYNPDTKNLIMFNGRIVNGLSDNGLVALSGIGGDNSIYDLKTGSYTDFSIPGQFVTLLDVNNKGILVGANSDGAFMFNPATNALIQLNPPAVPIPAAVWFFISGLAGLLGIRYPLRFFHRS